MSGYPRQHIYFESELQTMKTEKISVKLLEKSGAFGDGIVDFVKNESKIEAKFCTQNVCTNYCGSVYFNILRLIRLRLEANGVVLLCIASRVDVYPSGMSRSMGGGRRAYKLKLGQQARKEDIVDIFEFADPSKIGSVEDQHNYFREWAKSLRK